jgi:hypothetical protein
MEPEESPSSRGAFLRRAGVTLAAAVGVLAIPARAKATYGKCCPSTSCPDCTQPHPVLLRLRRVRLVLHVPLRDDLLPGALLGPFPGVSPAERPGREGRLARPT